MRGRSCRPALDTARWGAGTRPWPASVRSGGGVQNVMSAHALHVCMAAAMMEFASAPRVLPGMLVPKRRVPGTVRATEIASGARAAATLSGLERRAT